MVESQVQNDKPLQPLEKFASILGTASTQKLFNIMVCWEKLTVKELIEKVGVSETQIYTILKNLESIGIIRKISRGVYGLTNNTFTNLLRDAYSENLKRILGSELYRISDIIEGEKSESAIRQFANLIQNWEPFLKKYFSHQISSMGENIIDSVLQGQN